MNRIMILIGVASAFCLCSMASGEQAVLTFQDYPTIPLSESGLVKTASDSGSPISAKEAKRCVSEMKSSGLIYKIEKGSDSQVTLVYVTRRWYSLPYDQKEAVGVCLGTFFSGQLVEVIDAYNHEHVMNILNPRMYRVLK